MKQLKQSFHSRIVHKITGILLSTALLSSTFTGLGAAVLPQAELQVAAAGDYGLADNIQDGNILHCFCWKYDDITAMLPEIAEAGFTSIQTSPPQATSGTGAWWWFYQPLGFYIGENAMGNKESLTRLCTEADKYGIKIIADVVANHLAGDHSRIQDDLKDSQYWHEGDYKADDGDRYRVTHGRIGMPDLNTEHSYVQQCVVKYIQELKGVGVDGIRFDAAKHIGLPSEGDQFWATVIGADSSLWYYGEILNNPGLSFEERDGQRSQAIAVMQEYAKYIGITDSIYGKTLRDSFNDGKVPQDFGCYAGEWISIPNNRLVYWGESHDTWSNNKEWGYSNDMNQNTIDRAYAIAASRNGIPALYFSRPSSKSKDDIHIGEKGSTHFTSKEVAAVNHFKNALNGQKDYYTTGDNCAVVCRPGGAVVVLGSGSDRDVSVPNGGGTTNPGTYTDEITGSTWVVTEKTITGHVGSTGIAVFYEGKNVPPPIGNVSISPTSGSFTDTMTVTLKAESTIADAAYTTSEGASGTFTGTKTITIGASTPEGGTVTVNVSGTKSDGTKATASATYTKKDKISAVTVNVDNSVGNWKEVYAYVYSGDGTSAKKMAEWPGVKMTETSPNYYTLDVSGYENAKVIFSDGTNSAANRYPADMAPGMDIGGKSMLFTMPNKWEPIPDPVKKLSVSLTASPTSITVGSPITLTAKPTNASGTVNYTFKVGSTVIPSSGAAATYTPKAAGSLTFTVTATDSTRTATANASVTVQGGDTPVVECSKPDGTAFDTETMDITLTLQNAASGTYSVDNGPVKSFTGSTTVTIGEGKIGDKDVVVDTTAKAADGTKKSYQFTFNKKYTVKTSSTSAGTLSKYYATNANGKGTEKTITVDGDISDWSSAMLIAQGTANDDPRVYRPDSMYEVGEDMYALYAAYDDSNLYLMWEMTNVQDVVAPIDDFPLTQGTMYMNQNFPFFIAIDTGKSDTIGNNAKTSTGATLWDSGITFENRLNRIVAISTNGANGPYVYGGDSTGLNKKEIFSQKDSGIVFKYGMGILSKNVYGINGAYGVNNKRVVGDMCSESAAWVDFNAEGHKSATMDYHYEMSIPLATLGVSKSDIQSTGLGVLIVITSGKSGMDCLPYDLSMNDQADKDDAVGSQEKNSFEKSDEDHITAAFARVGTGDTPVPPVPPTPDTPLQVNFGADRSAPQLASTSLTLKGIGYGGTAPYKYAFYVDGTQVQASSTKDTYTWTPGTVSRHVIKCVITDSTGKTAESTKYFTAEGAATVALSNNSTISSTTIDHINNDSITIKGKASGGTAPYQYAYYYKKSTASSYTTLKGYSTATSATFKLSASQTGTYNIKVKVKDSSGTVKSKTFTVTSSAVAIPLTNKSTLSATTITLGSKVTVRCAATGGTKPYQYQVSYAKNGSSSYITAQKYSTNTTVTIKPGAPTVYKIIVAVKDAHSIVKKQLLVTVTDPNANALKNTSKVSATSVTLGKSITITGQASGGTSPYQYAAYYKKAGASSFTKIRGYSSTATMTFKPAAVSSYLVRIKVKDKTGKAVNKDITVKATAAPLTNNSTISSTSITLGQSVTIVGKASGGTTPYQYAYYYKKSTDSGFTTLKAMSTTAKAVFKPSSVGTYTLKTKVKDKTGTVASKTLTLKVTAAALKNSSTVSAQSVTLGKSITITGKASGGTAPYQYAAAYKKSSSSSYTSIRTYGKTATMTFKPAVATSYNLLVKVKDNKGKIVSKTFTIRVTKPTTTELTNKSTLSATSIKLGSKVTVNCAAAGGKTPYQYFVSYRKSSSNTATTVQKYSTNKTVSFKPAVATTYIVRVKVKDAAGTVKTKEVKLTVKK